MLREEIPFWCTARGFDASRLAAYGWSMGGYGSLRLAERNPDLLRMVAVLSPAVARLTLQDGEGKAMTPDELLTYCLRKPGAWQDEPWDGDVVVKVAAKIFAFLSSGTSVGVKSGKTREEADEWLARYPQDASVMPYIGRSGWNTLRIGGAIPDDELLEAVDASYDTVVSKLAKKDRPSAAAPRA